nr:uncharacterized protein LOC108120696 [Drosophila bipectinata]
MIAKISCLILLASVAEFRATPTNQINSVRSKRSGGYKVTIYNDNRISDGQGFVHTWLVIENGNRKTTFSFSSGGRCGRSSASEMGDRGYSDKLEYNVSKSQYDNMITEIEKFYDSCPGYRLLGDLGKYNCVSSANRILSAGGIGDFSGCKTPMDVQNQIRKDFNYRAERHWAPNYYWITN